MSNKFISMGNSELFYYGDVPEALGQENRTFAVQVVIMTRDRVWLWKDPDGGREEVHVDVGGEATWPNSRDARLNAVSGGVKQFEAPTAAAVREMRTELSLPDFGQGELRLRDDLPLIMCGQHKPGRLFSRGSVYLMGALIAQYQPTIEEQKILETKGRFWPLERVARHLNGFDEVFRPAFSFAVRLLQAEKEGLPLIDMIKAHNDRVLAWTVTKAWTPRLDFQFPQIFRNSIEEEVAL